MKESTKAAQAFSDYVAMGPQRSLRALHERYRQRRADEAPTRRFETLAEWSKQHRWQARIAEATTARAEHMLEEAAELDAETFLLTSRNLNERAKLTTPMMLDALVKMRESVRKPTPKGSTSVTVGVSVSLTAEQREIAERIAASRGVDAEDVIEEVEHYLRGQTA